MAKRRRRLDAEEPSRYSGESQGVTQ
ncbi:hypothetical protein MC885_014318 [Smutsia gigantea]|nr:hypothetical protein MC885_014318 [Smutsia gigantea]